MVAVYCAAYGDNPVQSAELNEKSMNVYLLSRIFSPVAHLGFLVPHQMWPSEADLGSIASNGKKKLH